MIPPKKRLVLLMDGTWSDGVTQEERDKTTNIWKMQRGVKPLTEDGLLQIVYYEKGIGSVDFSFGDDLLNLAEYATQGYTGYSISTKIQIAFHFVCRNWQPGDEIVIFGFSRGAYTARVVADLLGDVGVLDDDGIEQLSKIYDSYQKLSLKNKAAAQAAQDFLAPFRQAAEKRHGDNFVVQCLGVFDTVGAIGLPGIVPEQEEYLGFNNTFLSKRVQNAFQALALNENRKVFEVVKWTAPRERLVDHQTVEQVWFAGAHSDVGGSYVDGDLSQITLAWMVSRAQGLVEFDKEFLLRCRKPYRPYGTLPPHDPFKMKGVFGRLGSTVMQHSTRTVELNANPERTVERLHSSVFEQPLDAASANWPPSIKNAIKLAKTDPNLVAPMDPYEIELKDHWEASGEDLPADDHGSNVLAGGESKAIKALFDRPTNPLRRILGR